MDAPTTEKKKDNKHRPSLSTVLSMVDVVFFYHNHYSYLVSHKQYWWASKQWYLFFSFNPESSAGSQLSFCLWLLYFTIVSVHFQCGSAKDMWRRIRRRKMTRINDKKPKIRLWVVKVKRQRPVALRFYWLVRAVYATQGRKKLNYSLLRPI